MIGDWIEGQSGGKIAEQSAGGNVGKTAAKFAAVPIEMADETVIAMAVVQVIAMDTGMAEDILIEIEDTGVAAAIAVIIEGGIEGAGAINSAIIGTATGALIVIFSASDATMLLTETTITAASVSVLF